MRPGICGGIGVVAEKREVEKHKHYKHHSIDDEEEGRERFEKEEEEEEEEEGEEQPRILCVLSGVIERLVARNDQFTDRNSSKAVTVFHGVRAPSIGIGKYLERIYKYTSCSPSCFVVAYIYIDRLVHRHPHFPVVSLNIHRLLLTSVLLSAKVLDDAHYNNAFYARVGGISNAELNRLELDFLFRLDFRLKVTGKVFESYCLHLEKEMLCKIEGQRVDRILPGFSRLMRRNSAESAANHEESTSQFTSQPCRSSITPTVFDEPPSS